ncbi:MAG: hypothetical protein HC814_03775, partial [Rhodobacteraceae bacterium]|nr:hypothetical protein [Paracoccaceae bacterium]
AMCKMPRPVAEFLRDHPMVDWVAYGGLPESPFHALAQKYLPKGPGAIFTFGNIPKRIAARDIPRVVKVLDQDVLVTALAGANDAGLQPSADFILENMSGRMADQLREAVEERGSVKSADMEEATGQIVQAIRAMESAGELLLIVEDDA